MTVYTGYPTVTPDEVHPSHDVREEGYLITDPYCQHCRAGAVENGDLLRLPCPKSSPISPDGPSDCG